MSTGNDAIAGLRKIGDGLRAVDEDLRSKSPRCQHCGKPASGFVPAGWTRERAGLCTCPPWKRDRP